MLISNESGSNNVITKIVIFIIIAEFVKQAKPFIKTASIYRPTGLGPAQCQLLAMILRRNFHSPTRTTLGLPTVPIAPINDIRTFIHPACLNGLTHGPSKTVLEPSGSSPPKLKVKVILY